MKTLKDKVIVITGASSGIGEAMAREYAARGAKVVLGARSVQKLQLLAGEIRRHGGQAAYCGVDVTRRRRCRPPTGRHAFRQSSLRRSSTVNLRRSSPSRSGMVSVTITS